MQTPKANVDGLLTSETSATSESAYILEIVMPTMHKKHIAIATYSSLTIGSPLIQWARREVQKGARLNKITEIYIGTIVSTQIDIMKFTLPTMARRIIQGK